MFETIDQVNWQALNNACGPSVGMARRIRDQASPSSGHGNGTGANRR
jgi:hypothetical protein